MKLRTKEFSKKHRKKKSFDPFFDEMMSNEAVVHALNNNVNPAIAYTDLDPIVKKSIIDMNIQFNSMDDSY